MFISKNAVTQFKSGLVLLVAATTVGLNSTSVSAASACKGLENKACNTAASCGWVNGYVRKDGREVKAFCRTTARAKSTQPKPLSIKVKTKPTSTGS